MEKEIRKLARSNYYQNLYNSSKECYGICIFDNSSNFSGLQLLFLYWLSTYAMLYQELATHEDELLTENVINSDLRCDAYLLHRKNKYDDFWKKHRREEQLNEIRQKHPTKHKSGNTTLISTKFYIEDKDNKNG